MRDVRTARAVEPILTIVMAPRTLRLVALLFVLLGAPPTLRAKEPAVLEDLAGVLTPIREKFKVPALGAAIVRARGVTALGVSGVRKWGGDSPVTRKDLWHLGSCTKAMTATLIARLVENGTLRFDDTLAKRLSKRVPKMHADYAPVTLELLLNNRGGAPSDLHAGGLWLALWQRKGTPREQRVQLLEGLLPNPPSYPPGSKFLYANAGFAIAGAAAEEATNTPWEDLMRRYVFTPLGMQHVGFDLPGTVGKLDQPLGHRPSAESWLPIEPAPGVDNPPSIGPAGTVHATLEDWGKFVAVHLRGARGEEQRFLNPKTFQRLHTPAKGRAYAMGWGVVSRPWGAGPVLMHNGSNGMWFCVAWVAPKRGFAVLVTCNAGGTAAEQACDVAAWATIQKALAGAGK